MVYVVNQKPAVKYVPKNVNVDYPQEVVNVDSTEKVVEAHEGAPKLNLDGSRDINNNYNVLVETIYKGVPELTPHQIDQIKKEMLVDSRPILGFVQNQGINDAEKDLEVTSPPLNAIKW